MHRHGLVREIIQQQRWTLNPEDVVASSEPFTSITYDTREVKPGSLLFIKGRFNPDFLSGVDAHGLSCYVSQTPYTERTAAPGIIVNDVHQAMSLLSAAFYDHPEREVTMVGITGTKGKTTTAYYTQAILNAVSSGRCALLSSVDNCLDGHSYTESTLTTPESLDLFRMIRAAADHGMRYMVMEVSSQAYKVGRVFGLTFDVGAFLNISPDHISPIEHPTFEDYLYCKRQIVANSKQFVMNAAMAHADLVRQDAVEHAVPLSTFAADDTGKQEADVTISTMDTAQSRYRFNAGSTDLGEFSLSLEGSFNAANAAAAIAIVHAVGVNFHDPALHAIETVHISGRMEHFAASPNLLAYVDYAHNYASVNALIDFIEARYGARHPRITLVTGSTGDKAIDRRKGMVTAAQDRIEQFVFTAEDTDSEPIQQICEQMRGFVTNPRVATRIILDRKAAVEFAVADGLESSQTPQQRLNILLVIGKGEERWIKLHNRHMPYEGDTNIIARLFKQSKQRNQSNNSKEANQ